MQIERSQAGSVDHLGRQYLAESHHYGGIQLKRNKGGNDVGIAHGDRSARLKAQALGEGLHRRGTKRLAAPARRGRLGIDRRDLKPSGDQFGQGGRGELRGAEKGDAHGQGFSGGRAQGEPRAGLHRYWTELNKDPEDQMRLATTAAILCLGLVACSKSDQASNPAASDLAAAGAEAKAAASDLARAASDEAPAVKQAGAAISQGVKDAAAAAGPEVKKAGTAIKQAAVKAGAELKSSATEAKEKLKNHDDDGDKD